MNTIDRITAWLSPQAGLKRLVAREHLAFVERNMSDKRAYDGAQRNRRTAGWKTSEAGPITEVRMGRQLLRQRSRDLIRNNPWGARAKRVTVANQIGTGIRPRAATGNPDLNAKIDLVHEAWSKNCAPESGRTLYGMQALAVGARFESGESLIVLDRSSGTRSGGVPLTLQVLEPDWLADDDALFLKDGAGWRDGIKFAANGTRLAYRLWASNPAEDGIVSRRDVREVPASDLVHLFRADRPGQIRGIPDLASVMMLMRDLDDYHDAARMLAKVQAILGAFVTKNGGPTASPLGAAGTDAAGNRVEELSPGMVGYLREGEDVKFLAPQGGGPYEAYTRDAYLGMAAGTSMTYHQLTGDLTQANYSSLRAGSLDARRQIEQDQHLILVPQMCQAIWDAFIEQAILVNQLPTTAAGAPVTFTPPRFELVDPNRDTEAMKSQIRAGLMTWPEAVSEMGYDPAAQLAEIKASNTALKDAGVILDIDPRVVTGSGAPVNSPAVSSIVLAAES